MSRVLELSRRSFLVLSLPALIVAGSVPSMADNGSDGGDGGDGGDDGGGNTGDGTSSAGGNATGSNSTGANSDQNRAHDAVKNGAAISLSKAFELLAVVQPGRVIEVRLITKGNGLDYRFKVIDNSGIVTVTSMDAATGHIRNRFGF